MLKVLQSPRIQGPSTKHKSKAILSKIKKENNEDAQLIWSKEQRSNQSKQIVGSEDQNYQSEYLRTVQLKDKDIQNATSKVRSNMDLGRSLGE